MLTNLLYRLLQKVRSPEEKLRSADYSGQLQAISKAQGVIEFSLDGTILKVNDNFAAVTGYQASEIVGQHHSMFVDPVYRASAPYQQFWKKLGAGNFDAGQYKRVGKNGKELWLQASYNPIFDLDGKPLKVVKYATEITAAKLQDADYQGQLAAISKAQGVIEFSLDGKILKVNDNFAAVTGYAVDEIVGQHHSMFVEPEVRNSTEYKTFWQNLALGHFNAGQFQRVGKDGSKIWLQASYNPILDWNGKPFKVVKYASDITHQKELESLLEGQLSAIGQSLGVIAFSPDGKVIEVNQNFLNFLGYSLGEAIGQHHSVFVEPHYKASQEYQDFWRKLNLGQFEQGVYKRIGKDGKEVWIQASYNPIKDINGNVVKVVKFATDITAEKTKAVDFEGQLSAIRNNQAVIEFTPDGVVLAVNHHFLNVMGYKESEAIGKHHSTFVDSAYRSSAEYRAFWEKLRRGKFDAGQYKRVAKGGREVWLQASYNPIVDINGKVVKVVKFASDVTSAVQASQALVTAVAETQSVVAAAKQGDLSQRIKLEDKSGDIADLCAGINALIDTMSSIIMQIKVAGETINTAAVEISTGNNHLSQRTEEQASSLEETAASMEQLAATVRQNAENSRLANQMASNASGVAAKGGQVVQQVVHTMADINDSSRRIEDITSVIDSIAFQTNILALNAAVEAARAGEQGRGFAVVASEVRNLAQRSAGAAKEIKQLIADSVGKVHHGTELVKDAGDTMEELVQSVQRVTDIMAEIAAASGEQSTGIDQVNMAVTQMDETTQQNAALVEEAAAAAESLLNQAASLVEAVHHFKLESSDTIISPANRKSSSRNVTSIVRKSAKSVG